MGLREKKCWCGSGEIRGYCDSHARTPARESDVIRFSNQRDPSKPRTIYVPFVKGKKK